LQAFAEPGNGERAVQDPDRELPRERMGDPCMHRRDPVRADDHGHHGRKVGDMNLDPPLDAEPPEFAFLEGDAAGRAETRAHMTA